MDRSTSQTWRANPGARRAAVASCLLILCCFTGLPPLFGQETPKGVDPDNQTEDGEWIALFNGKDLEGWTPKFTGHELGDNVHGAFRVADGVLQVNYSGWKEFGTTFGHLFWREKYSHYRLRVEYRFIGEQCPGGPGWALRNSGAMLHCQDPASMTKDQEFPVSIEAQFLGGADSGERSTNNLCTPGTHVVIDEKLVTQHCTSSRSKTYRGDEWVTVEIEVRGHGNIRHFVEGELVLEYERPVLDPGDADARRLLEAGAKEEVSEGYISLQAESHPVEFRKVELLVLDPSDGGS
ncbi:MAG TPA: DUF1080 domain-containing protein [Verrucomicrobiales bacterium]|nr:DUF1080 domain-containing protein [Verrucomicrobiales bacterium]